MLHMPLHDVHLRVMRWLCAAPEMWTRWEANHVQRQWPCQSGRRSARGRFIQSFQWHKVDLVTYPLVN